MENLCSSLQKLAVGFLVFPFEIPKFIQCQREIVRYCDAVITAESCFRRLRALKSERKRHSCGCAIEFVGRALCLWR